VTTSDAVAPQDESLLGHYAGVATRLGAFIIDLVISVGIFYVVVLAIAFVVRLFTGNEINVTRGSAWWGVPLVAWEFLYFWYCWTVAGKTPGMALFGLRVVRGDGTAVRSGRAAARTLFFLLSWAFFIPGFLGIIFGKRRRALHDVIANTAVVYDFDARAAHLRSIVRRLGRRAPSPG
jgi:uncharacterized RDD family membrane protein YckC